MSEYSSANSAILKLSSSKVDRIWGNVMVPGDKSMSHRALILASQAVGRTHIQGLLESDDVVNTAEALKKLGVNIERDRQGYYVDGVGVGGLTAPTEVLDMGNSGTAARLLMGLVASYDFETKFTGDESLCKRPMGRVIEPLTQMGAEIQASENGTMPLTVIGSSNLAPITYTSPVASAQLKSCIMLAALNVAGKTTIIEPEATRNHTEKMMKYLGVDLEVKDIGNGKEVTITGQPELEAKDFIIPADPSSAAFLLVAALIVPNAELCVRDVMINPLRAGLYNTLKEMGADIEYHRNRVIGGEEVADIVAKTSNLKAIEIPADRAPSMIDEYPILAIAASCANGKTIMKGLHELRVKESDRLQAVWDGLIANKVKAEIDGDDLIINGGGLVGGGLVNTHMDHRLAMAFLVAGMASDLMITIDDGTMINTSFPGFRGLINAIGADIHRVL